jgi:hypothetical protein
VRDETSYRKATPAEAPRPASFAAEREEATLLKKAGLIVKRRATGCRMAHWLLRCQIVVDSGLKERMARRSKIPKCRFWMNHYRGSALLAN